MSEVEYWHQKPAVKKATYAVIGVMVAGFVGLIAWAAFEDLSKPKQPATAKSTNDPKDSRSQPASPVAQRRTPTPESGSQAQTSQVPTSTENLGEAKWFAKTVLNMCEEKDLPGLLKNFGILNRKYRTVDEEKVGDVPTRVRLELLDSGQTMTFYRGKERCEALLAAEEAKNKAEVNRYR